jgi:hypothetical protein
MNRWHQPLIFRRPLASEFRTASRQLGILRIALGFPELGGQVLYSAGSRTARASTRLMKGKNCFLRLTTPSISKMPGPSGG